MLLRRTILLGTSVLAGALALAAPTFAQTTPPSEEATTVTDIVVTGSRIRNPQFTSPSPLQVITKEEAELRGTADAATALLGSSLAAASTQINDQITGYILPGQAGGGTQSLSLRGLGTQRTLTLMNGRRAGPAGTRGSVGAFDLNVVPQSLVERFDILKDGASSTYGSDAVAGVVNIITTQTLDGGEINFYANQPFETGGEVYRADAAFGKVFERGYINAGVEYYRANILRRSDRDMTSCTQDYLYDEEGGERVDYVDPRTGDYKCFNQNSNYVQVSGGPYSGFNLMRAVPGVTYPTAAQGNNSPFDGWVRWGRNGYPETIPYAPSTNEYWERGSVISPVERTTVAINGGFDVTPNAQIYTELLFNRRDSSQYGSAQLFPNFAQRNTLNGAANVLPASNPNNPFGYNVVPVSIYESNTHQRVDYYRAVVGVRGDFNTIGRDWSYDLYGQYSLSDAVYNNGPRLYLDRFLATMSPNVACTNNPAGGNFSNFNCADLPNGVPWTSDRVLRGDFTQQERDFLFVNEDGTTTYDHYYVEGVISTDRLFTLPAGDVGFAAGFQIRHEEIDDTPGFQARNRNTALFSSAGRTAGSDDIREAFLELDLPILKDLALANSLNVNISGRVSDYDSYGNSSTYKIGVNYQVTPEYRLRASTGTSFRAPALYEQFLGSQIAYGSQSSTDPCYNWGESGVDTTIQSACSALGIPADYVATGGSSVPIASIGGRGNLEAETADTMNLGFVWTPSFANLNVAIDYFDITIKDAVDQFGAYNILEQCLRGNTDFCSLYTRDSTSFFVTGVNNAYVNVAEQKNTGLDLAIRYVRELPFGVFSINSQHTWKLKDERNILGGVHEDVLGNTFNYNGPAYSGNLNFTLTSGPMTYFYGIDAIGKGSDLGPDFLDGSVFANARYADLPNGINSADCSAPNNYCVFYKGYTEFTAVHSASVRYEVNDWTFQAGINNLWDEAPPAASANLWRNGIAALNGYDMRGRRGFIRVGRSF